MVGHGFLTTQPYAMSESERASYANNCLEYPHGAAQAVVGKGYLQFGGLPSGPVGLPRGTSANGSEMGSDNSLSPKSYTSDMLSSEVPPFTPATTVDTSSESSHWARYNAPSYGVIKVSSPKDVSKDVSQMPADVSTIEYHRRQQYGLGNTIPSPTPAGPNGLPNPGDDWSQHDSDYSYSQQSSPGVAPWENPRRSYNQAVVPSRPQGPQTTSAPFSSFQNAYQAHSSNSRSYEAPAWNEPRAHVAANHFQDRFQIPRTVVDVQAQRKADDEILLEGKRNGLTYKEIRKKMHAKPAESTLRGRYRSLTKARKDRVRKPVWRSMDVSLAGEALIELDADRGED